ncbi:hypothetical protein [Streptomyces fructofermentans]|uniref:DUF5709 domain-containing protein n=1 Tax=Streptomyces fructofermentans TaxID=152141 RepID=A0A918K2W6_9ACTN|nr:hypothetical protein [Streptomyces fructofermentans]GGX40493.1 hypothetical protein GCM10010515_04090 [Streptomyces fructofermentans]
MTVDPTDPEALTDTDDTKTGGDRSEFDVEAPEADTAEQHADLAPRRDDPLTDAKRNGANEADVVEQARVVELDEDDYR